MARKSFGMTVGVFLLLSLPAAVRAQATEDARLVQGKFGKALNLDVEDGRKLIIPTKPGELTPPVTFEFWLKMDNNEDMCVLLSSAPKSDKTHWELQVNPPSGALRLTMPQMATAGQVTSPPVADGNWHFIALRIEPKAVDVYVDGKAASKIVSADEIRLGDFPVLVGALQGAPSPLCAGAVDDLRISRGSENLDGFVPTGPLAADDATLHLYEFDALAGDSVPDQVKSGAEGEIVDRSVFPKGDVFLDEVEDAAYAASDLHGDEAVEEESRLPALEVKAQEAGATAQVTKPEAISLAGEWLMKGSPHLDDASLDTKYESKALMEGWYKPDFQRDDWLKVQVPTSVQSALIAAGQLADPNWNDNTYQELMKFGEPKKLPFPRRLTRIEQSDWWFARSFTLPAEWQGRNLRLYFDGLDYAGSVYLNGQSLGFHAGMFGGPTYDVSKMVKFDGPNWLVVRIDRVPERSWWDGVLKGSPGWGWMYGHLVSLGIWRDVRVEALPTAEVSAPYVVTKSIEGKKAVLQIEYYITSHEPGIHAGRVTGTIRGANFEGQAQGFSNEIQIPYGESRYRTEVIVDDAHPWWPLNYGDPNLYELGLTAAMDGAASGSCKTRFGIRTIEMRPAAGTMAREDYRWQFVINGQPMFIKGANWCWSDPMLQCDPAKYERMIGLAKRAGMQMFRAWGGGIIETDEFYRLCDENGLMVYQEFPFCWGPADFPRTDPVVEDQQVSQVVKRLRNHPALVMWGGGNENSASLGNDEGLFLAGRRCRQYDPSRPFHRTDPWGGSSHNYYVFSGVPIGPGYWRHPSVWYGEFGLPSMPGVESMRKFWPEETIAKWPPSPTDGGVMMHMNQFSMRDVLKQFVYADYGPITSWETYAEYSQMAQGDWLRFAAEGQRSGSGRDKTGLWFYKFSDLFPVQSWAVVDFYGSPKISYYRAKQTYRPQSAYATYPKLDWAENEPFAATIHVSNDTSRTLTGARVTATIYGSDLKPVWNKEYAVESMAANERRELETIQVAVPAAQSKPFLLAVTMRDEAQKMISDQWYWMNFEAKSAAMKKYGFPFPMNLSKVDPASPDVAAMFQAYATAPQARLLTLPKTALAVKCVREGGHGYLAIRNSGDLPAFNVLIDGFPDDWKAFLDDNSFCLRPREERDVAFELAESKPLNDISVRAWNAPAVKPD